VACRRRARQRLLIVGAGVVVSLNVGVGSLWAASGDADGTYTVTVTKVEASQDGSTFTTLFEGSQDINIAAVGAGAVAAGLVSGASVGTGTYTTVRVTIGSTLRVKGFVNNSAGTFTFYTNGGTDGGAFSTNIGAPNTPGGDYAIATFTVDAANRTNTTTGLSIVVAPGAGPTVTVKFDTSGVIVNTPSIRPPTVTISSR
jgi:hypothetical protein